MGKHDKRDAVIDCSSEEFLKNRIERLEADNNELRDRLAFSQETITKLQEQCGRMSKWASEIEANAQDEANALRAEIARRNEAIIMEVLSRV